MSASEPRNLNALKGLALLATFTLATAQTTTSLFFVPALLKPLDGSRAPFSTTRKNSSTNLTLSVPATPGEGRLTPLPNGTFDFTTGSSGTYKAIARQFSQLNSLALKACLPLELFSIAVFSVAAVRSRNGGSALWKQWVAAAAMIGGVRTVTGFMMTPLILKIKRIGGEAEKIEPYEDAPIDLDAEKSNTVEFLGKWSALNLGRGVAMFAAGLIAGITLFDE